MQIRTFLTGLEALLNYLGSREGRVEVTTVEGGDHVGMAMERGEVRKRKNQFMGS